MSARTLRNPIMRQLQRHARLAAIYRVADGSGSGESAGLAGFGAAAGAAPPPIPAQAYLWPTVDEQTAQPEEPNILLAQPAQSPAETASRPLSSAPVVQRMPADLPRTSGAPPRVAPPRSPTAAQPPAPSSAFQGPAINRPEPKPVQAAAPPPPATPTTAKTPALSPASPAADPAASTDEMDSTTWSRLETIFRRHQAVEEGTAEPVRSSEAASSGEPVGPNESSNASSSVPGKPSASDVQDAASAPTLIQRTTAPAPSSDRSPAAAVPPASQPAPVQRAPDAPARVDSTADPDPFLPGWSDDAAQADIPPEDMSVNPSPDADLPARLPLEAVWPVERSSPPAARSGPAVSGPSPVQGQEPDPGEAAQLRSTLAQVSPEQASDSSIELVPTRRPRSTPLAPPPSRVPSGAGSQAAPAIQKQVMESSGPTASAADLSPDLTAPAPGLARSAHSPTGGAGSQSAETGFPADVPTGPIRIQRAADAEAHPAAQTGAATPAGMVPTDIGALPADLWTLIGQPAPPSTPQPAPQRDSAPAAAPEPAPAALDTLSFSANRVQRAEADDNPAPAQPGGQTSQAPAGQAAGQPNQPDIDQLARSVYAEVRRRLNQEWERMRRR